MMDYLQKPKQPQKSSQSYYRELSRRLIDNYIHYGQGDWFTFPDDDYSYRYLVYHAIQADAKQFIQQLIVDFNWMTMKLKSSKTLHSLCTDIQDCRSYLNKNYHQVLSLFLITLAIKAC